ncbi:hypothetical protein EPA93_19160 [Ktedonosporobacter rubrisoli]|uniref:Uncharacterized protein n=1 Tax=Ktedonosporobacter rubrisoli TaxID=2509675 RepID=A0A4P6JRC2_KTERU|nr:hypothetical protein [Ktedonosporobacter rubrisoli]QBD77999.1 hypothetical protein EPA93_19160 [Ktedonosporobacter rubrisoli]
MIQFQQGTLRILIRWYDDDPTGFIEVPATYGIGTGLAYHLDEERKYYCITHVPSGYKLVDVPLKDELQVRQVLARIAELDPDRWNVDQETLKKRHSDKNWKMYRTFEAIVEGVRALC